LKLTKLYCENNQLTQLNVSNNVNLTDLICKKNKLTQLDVPNSVNLINFLFYKNPITNFSHLLQLNPEKLTTLFLDDNSLMELKSALQSGEETNFLKELFKPKIDDEIKLLKNYQEKYPTLIKP
jgi:Leucine-rich repeat (LRR) protein